MTSLEGEGLQRVINRQYIAAMLRGDEGVYFFGTEEAMGQAGMLKFERFEILGHHLWQCLPLVFARPNQIAGKYPHDNSVGERPTFGNRMQVLIFRKTMSYRSCIIQSQRDHILATNIPHAAGGKFATA